MDNKPLKIEYVGPDDTYPGSKVYSVTALHAIVSGNGRLYTKKELSAAAESLSFRPLNINHDDSRRLPYPQNSTLHPMAWDQKLNAVTGRVRIADPAIQQKIEGGQIRHVSVDQVSNETCSDASCSSKLQYGMAFVGLALLDGYSPGDPQSEIKPEARQELSLARLVKSEQDSADSVIQQILDNRDAQLLAQKQLVDALAAKLDANPDDDETADQLAQAQRDLEYMALALLDLRQDKDESGMDACMSEVASGHPDWPQNQRVAVCLKKLGKEESDRLASSLSARRRKNEQTMSSQSSATEAQPPQAAKQQPPASSQAPQQTQFVAFTPEQFDALKNLEQKKLEGLMKELIPSLLKPFTDEQASMRAWLESQAKKQEAQQMASSKVADLDAAKARKEEYDRVVSFFDRIRKTGPNAEDRASVMWTLNKQEFYDRFAKEVHTVHVPESKPIKSEVSKGEAVTINAGDQGQVFTKTILVVPGGRMKVPVRQYCYFQSVADGADRAHFYSIPAFDFGAITEGTEPTNPSQTVTKSSAITAVRGAVQRVGYSQIEAAPYGLVDAINAAMLIAAIVDEATDLLKTTYSAVTPTNWIRGDTGAATTTSDIAALGAMTRVGVLEAKRLIRNQGYDVSPGNLVLFLHPEAYSQLLADSNLNTYYQYARPEVTDTEMLERLYGVDIVIANQLNSVTGTSGHPNAWENVMAVKGVAFGMASGRDLMLEAQRRNELQQTIISGTQRVKSVVIEQTATCRIASLQ